MSSSCLATLQVLLGCFFGIQVAQAFRWDCSVRAHARSVASHSSLCDGCWDDHAACLSNWLVTLFLFMGKGVECLMLFWTYQRKQHVDDSVYSFEIPKDTGLANSKLPNAEAERCSYSDMMTSGDVLPVLYFARDVLQIPCGHGIMYCDSTVCTDVKHVTVILCCLVRKVFFCSLRREMSAGKFSNSSTHHQGFFVQTV